MSHFFIETPNFKSRTTIHNVEIILATGPYAKRTFTYNDCFIKAYNVDTLRDNEEGYMNKGFAVVDNFTVECRTMQFQNPALVEMNTIPEEDKAHTKNTLDLKDTSTWSPPFKSTNPGSPTQ